MPAFTSSYLELHQIGANLCQIEAVRAETADARAAVGAVLGEIHILARCDCGSVVRGHEGIEICKSQHSSGGALGSCFADRTLRAGRTNGPLGADGTGFTCWTLGANGAGCAYGARYALGALRAGRTNGPLGADGTGFTYRTLGTNGAGCTYGARHALGALRAGRSCGTGRTGLTGRPLRAYGPGNTGRSLGTGRAGFSSGPLWPYRPGYTLGPLRSGGTGLTDGALGTHGTLWACNTLGPLWPLRAGWAVNAGISVIAARLIRAVPLAAKVAAVIEAMKIVHWTILLFGMCNPLYAPGGGAGTGKALAFVDNLQYNAGVKWREYV